VTVTTAQNIAKKNAQKEQNATKTASGKAARLHNKQLTIVSARL